MCEPDCMAIDQIVVDIFQSEVKLLLRKYKESRKSSVPGLQNDGYFTDLKSMYECCYQMH